MTGLNCQTSSEKKRVLGIFTKTHVKQSPQGLQRVHDFLLQDQSAKLLPLERVTNCLKKRIDKNKNRTVMLNEVRKKMHYGNVQRCGSIWICPVCAKKITEHRRDELQRGLSIWRSKGNYAYLMSLTFSHQQFQSLTFLFEGQRKALKIFYQITRVQDILKGLGVQFKIKSLEVTYGKNGWHPHNHILLLSTKYLGISAFVDAEQEFSKLWIKACLKAGLNAPSMEYGLDLRDGSYAEKYISKWGLEQEMTKGHVKKGRNGGHTPFDILQMSITDQKLHNKETSKLWQEFGVSSKRKRQLEWGRGLKKYLGLDEIQDQEIVDETEKQSIQVYDVPALLFYLLNKYQKRHVFIQCLEKDWESGSFGSGTAEDLIIELIELEESKLDDFDDVYFSQILRIMA